MISSHRFTMLCLSFVSIAAARSLIARDSPYEGGWPLGLSTSATDTCPANSVACPTTNVNPSCCPAGNTCVWGSSVYQNYCCPTGADCNEAVVNFPRCAFDNQTMFMSSAGGYFCCNPGELGVAPSTGKSGGLCEPANQAIPTSLLATKTSQVGLATPAPTPGGPGSNNATTTEGSAGSPTQTNPSKSPTSTSSSDAVTKAISKWPLATKIGIGAGIFVGFIILCVVSSILRSRRQRNRRVIPGVYGYENEVEFDEYGNRVNAYGAGYVSRPGYEPYRGTRAPAPPANNVTVNVVQGDLSQ